jgi:hypothetical protein
MSSVALISSPALAQIDYGVDPASDVSAEIADSPLASVDGYTDRHAWVGAPVYAEGRRVGAVARVHVSGAEVDALVIATTGGGRAPREVEAPLTDATLGASRDGRAVFTLALSAEEIGALPDFDPNAASPAGGSYEVGGAGKE